MSVAVTVTSASTADYEDLDSDIRDMRCYSLERFGEGTTPRAFGDDCSRTAASVKNPEPSWLWH